MKFRTRTSSKYPSGEAFDERYFKTGNYVNYLQRKYDKQAQELIQHFKLDENSKIVDFGCAIGGLIRQLKARGIGLNGVIVGTDISNWAVQAGRDMGGLDLHYYNRNLLTLKPDLLILLDVLEHMPDDELRAVLDIIRENPPKQALIRIPVSAKEGEDFVLEVSRNDKTHLQVHCKGWWIDKMTEANLTLTETVVWTSIYDSNGVLAGIFTPTTSSINYFSHN